MTRWTGESIYFREALTSVSLDSGRDFSCSDAIEIWDVLTQDSLEVSLTNALCVDFTSVDPDVHVCESCHENSATYIWALGAYEETENG